MKTFDDILNEGKLNINGNAFVVNTFYDKQGLCLSFIPYSKVLDTYSKNEIVEMIQDILKKRVPELAEMFWFESGHDSAGLTFRLNTTTFTEYIEKKLK
jgi:hypothetical protein